jgi:hypothetical protein
MIHLFCLQGYFSAIAWPGLAQIFRIERHVITKKGAKEHVEVVYGVTSLSAERASAV